VRDIKPKNLKKLKT